MTSIAILIISLGVILVGAEVFVNGIEWLGHELNLSEGAVGSVLAAVGTALPETIIPIIAIVFSPGNSGHEIGIGAILGAPLMLATLAMFVSGIAVLVFSHKRISSSAIVADYSTMSRDLSFFIIIYATAMLAGAIPPHLRLGQLIIAVLMVLAYFYYVYIMLTEERDASAAKELPNFYFDRHNNFPTLRRILLQVFLALVLIIWGANMFVGAITDVAIMYGIPAFILALIITPIATELPEKFNSVIWISREKDTLALGNITGAMVFQSSLIPAIGIFLTPWQLTTGAFISGIIALMSAGLIYYELRIKKHISVGILLLGGVFYLAFIVLVVKGIIS
ncbi:MAG TPA: sodium:calcium antiporter [Syntrophomonadaceae bacterium]|nr:sodium:calcium antiporter [Syntrophomonadaceae bacterium]